MPNLLIRRLPKEILDQAKKIASMHHRSLQEEISQLLIETVRLRSGRWSKKADLVRKRLAKPGRQFSDSAKLIREDRSR